MDTYKNMLESMYPILKAKRGEFWVYTEPDDEVDYIFIFSNFDHNHYVRDICGLEFDGTYLPHHASVYPKNWSRFRQATDEEKDKLKKALKDKGYIFDENELILKEI